VERAINHGKHVYVEKSFAMSEREVLELLELAENRCVAVTEGFMFLHHRQLRTITSILRDGVIGDLRYVYSCFGFPPLLSDDFRYNPSVGGGALMDAAGYPTRLIRHLLGASAQMRLATLVKSATGASLRGSAFYTASGEVSATSVFGFDQQYQCCVEILGSKGRVRTDRIFTARPNHRVKIVLEIGSDSQVIEEPEDDHFLNAMRAFLQLIRMPETRVEERENIRQQSADLASIERLSFFKSHL
jgi:predicted dehydrogenase